MTRRLYCVKCDMPWQVIELQIGSSNWQVDPDRYVCPDCRNPVKSQLEIKGNLMVDELPYDTSMVAIPY